MPPAPLCLQSPADSSCKCTIMSVHKLRTCVNSESDGYTDNADTR